MTTDEQYDCILSYSELEQLGEIDIYDKIEETSEVPEKVIDYVNKMYLGREDEIDYIYYTGVYCNPNFKHSLDEFIEIARGFNFEGTWPCLILLTGALVAWKKQPKFKHLINGIFRYLRMKEENCKNEYYYYTHQEFDSNNATRFEEMSNSYLVGVRTNLDEKFVGIMICLFKMIIDKNYFRLEDIEESIDIAAENREKDYTNEELELIKAYDLYIWIDVLSNIAIEFDKHSSVPKEKRKYLLRNIKTGKIAHPELLLFKQKYFRSDELHADLRVILVPEII